MHDIASELQWIGEAGSQAGVATSVKRRRKTWEKLTWMVAAVVVALATALENASAAHAIWQGKDPAIVDALPAAGVRVPLFAKTRRWSWEDLWATLPW